MKEIFVFNLIKQSTEQSELKLDELYLGCYENNDITKELIVNLISDINEKEKLNVKVTLDKVEKLYKWNT